jgi:crotonobetainyl-CoA:carnitine CoA-transferase CaiB-like acyl-CoA transferase
MQFSWYFDRPSPMSSRALQGIRVVECGGMVAAAYAAKLFADLGADVVKIEPLHGDPARQRGPFPGGVANPETSGLFLYLNANAGSPDLHPGDEPFCRVATGDLLIHNYATADGGLDLAYEGQRANPS